MSKIRTDDWINIAAPVRDAIAILLSFCNQVNYRMGDVLD